MSEIEKMYENAGIKPTKNWQSCLNCKLKTETRYDDWGEEYLTCNRLEMPEKCSDAKEYYPIFTAEKQIELIKWLANKFSFFAIELDSQQWSSSNGLISGFYKNSLEESIADYINNLWQDLTATERKEIKEILKG